ncbi:hypothetical protein DV738_g4944, partial [Chaetothyriales sp. CBS 135597]
MDYNADGGGTSYTTYGGAGDTHGGGGFTVRPVTIAQIMSASHPHPDAEFKIDGSRITLLTFVGQVRFVQQQATNVTYKIDDGTGIVEVKQWINSDDNNNDDDNSAENDHDEFGGGGGGGMDIDGGEEKKKKQKQRPVKREIKEDDYVRVWGRLKDFHNKRHIGSHIIRHISDYNEINYHLLEATANQQDPYSAGAGVGAGGDGGPSLSSAVSPGARKVFQCLQQANSNEGLNVNAIATNARMNLGDVCRGIEELVQEGVIFTTIDDDTYAILGG